MASPDMSEYVDLTINDRDAQELYEAAVAQMQIDIPAWVPREGNTEVLLLEALALMVSESIFAINRVPDGVLEAMIKFFGVERDYGDQPTVDLRFHMSGTLGYTIPASTAIAVQSAGGEAVQFRTEVDLTIPAGQNYGVATAIADDLTASVNGIAAGTVVELVDAIIYVDYVTLETDISGGRDAESDEDYLQRGMQRFQRLSDTLVTPNDFVAAALEYPFVKRAKALDLYDPAGDPDNNGPVGNDEGHVTLALYGDGANLSTDEKNEIITDFTGMMQANLELHVINPTIVNVDVSCTVTYDQTYDQADVITRVTQALEAYLDPSVWEWGTLVRRNELISLIDGVEGVLWVDTVTIPASNLTLTGVAPLATAGVINVVANPEV